MASCHTFFILDDHLCRYYISTPCTWNNTWKGNHHENLKYNLARTVEGCTNPNCKAKKHLTHTTSNCYWPGGGKEGQFPPNFSQRARENATTSNTVTNSTPTSNPANPTPQGQTDHFVLLVQTFATSGQSGVLIDVPSNYPHYAFISKGFQNFGKGKVPTFLDSGASDTMFILKESFVEYKPIDS
jgi:hypothetical protein